MDTFELIGKFVEWIKYRADMEKLHVTISRNEFKVTWQDDKKCTTNTENSLTSFAV